MSGAGARSPCHPIWPRKRGSEGEGAIFLWVRKWRPSPPTRNDRKWRCWPAACARLPRCRKSEMSWPLTSLPCPCGHGPRVHSLWSSEVCLPSQEPSNTLLNGARNESNARRRDLHCSSYCSCSLKLSHHSSVA
jgi:hypothetical protein